MNKPLPVQSPLTHGDVGRGSPNPLGVVVSERGVNFSVYAPSASSLEIEYYTPGIHCVPRGHVLCSQQNKTGDIWHVRLPDTGHGTRYCYWVTDEDQKRRWVLDPYGKAIDGLENWGEKKPDQLWSIVHADEFDWGDTAAPNTPLRETIIYELHVRGFTRDTSSSVRCPGTYGGLTEKLSYIKDLGVTTIELMPIFEFIETEGVSKKAAGKLVNYWGYQPISWMIPKASYSQTPKNGQNIRAFRSLIKACHEQGLEVILDVVYNHTGEGGFDDSQYSMATLAENHYYIKDSKTDNHTNYSGCGNTVNTNDPVVMDLIIGSLRYWVSEMRVDGFRFDLGGVFCRDHEGAYYQEPPILRRIVNDPVLANTKLMVEPWDAAGIYLQGRFPYGSRISEWNSHFRDTVRGFVKGDEGKVDDLRHCLLGSPHVFAQGPRKASRSVNLITCHDGFTLRDLVSYNDKHNKANFESNRDGSNHNVSWNCGIEGDTKKKKILKLRDRQQKNLFALLMLSRGVPLMLAGDEFGRSQQGNNNGYCQDNSTSWLDWNLLKQNKDFYRFCKNLIALRKAYGIAEEDSFDSDNVRWHGIKLNQPDLDNESRSLAFHREGEVSLYVALNAYWEPLTFELPKIHGKWFCAVNTARDLPYDSREPGEEYEIGTPPSVILKERSLLVLTEK